VYSELRITRVVGASANPLPPAKRSTAIPVLPSTVKTLLPPSTSTRSGTVPRLLPSEPWNS
jgi:hypothetical protein